MGKGKLEKFAEMASNPLVVEQPYNPTMDVTPALRGRWHEEFFHNAGAIVLELGCGRGEYTVGLARRRADVNYIGVDIKGARMWTGAQEALRTGMKNVGFLRTNIEFIHKFFAPGEVDELWLTFSDPQMKKVTKRLTSTYFLRRYSQFLKPDGLIHLKTDSNFLFTYTEEMLRVNRLTPEVVTRNLYAEQGDDTEEARSIQTYYEEMWRARGIDIKYLRFRLPALTDGETGGLVEPEVDIPMDEYRSYNRVRRG
ncbi:MAG: tRNA (guanosine(46)-N7)-methyltransferase TrmB [Bacteroidaceae bacterium]|nr:tRNA (guanosine(46)-N7)-methyltransferase TrmB [Bacteroidaceae bacterium]